MSHIQFKLKDDVGTLILKPTLNWGLCVGMIAVGLVGCQHEAPKPPPPKPAEVMVSIPLQETVTEFEEVTGRTWAVNTIEIRSRVSGYLDKVYFRDGSEIKAGDLLFEIDQRPFKADLDRAIAAVKQGEAHLERLVRQEERMKKLLPSKAITMDEFEAIQFERAEADAALAAAKAAEETAQLNLGFTRVTSKISGTVGRRLIDPGNLVKADETALATVVSLNPIYAYFDLDERTVLRLRRMIQQGAVKSPQDVELPAQVAVADDPNYTMTGVINFIDNQLDGSTGTLRGRAMIHNHEGLLSPGLFVRLRVPIGAPHKAILVREEALGSDQGQRFVYVIDKVMNKDTGKEEDVVAYRRVQIGMLIGGRRVIESGLALNERVVVTGLQRVRPGAKVQAKMVDKDGKLIAQAEPVMDKPAEKKTAEVAHGAGK